MNVPLVVGLLFAIYILIGIRVISWALEGWKITHVDKNDLLFILFWPFFIRVFIHMQMMSGGLGELKRRIEESKEESE